MNKIIIILSLISILSTNIVAQNNFTLDDCLNILFERSSQYKNLQFQYERLEANREIDLVYKYPTISMNLNVPFHLSQNVKDIFNSDLDRYNLILQTNNNFRPLLSLGSNYSLPTGGDIDVKLSTYYNTSSSNYANDREDFKYSFNAIFSQPLFEVNSYRIDAEKNESRYKKSKLEFFQSKNDFVFNAIEKYYNTLLKQEQIAITKESLEKQKRELELNELNYKLGKSSKIELVNNKLSLKETELDLAKSEEDLSKAKNDLLLFLGIDRNTPITLDESIEFIIFNLPLETAQDMVIINNPEFQELQLNLIIANLDYETKSSSGIKTEFIASSLISNSTYYRPENYQTNLYDYNVSLNVKVPLADGGQRDAEEDLARIKIDEQEITIEEKQKSLNLKVEEFYASFEYYKNNFSLLNEKLEISKNSHEIYKKEYKLGRISFDELQEYENKIYQAEKDIIGTVIDYNKKVLELKTILGIGIVQ